PENVRDIFATCDVVVEAFDEVAGKKLLMETYGNSGKLFVCASGLAGWGNADDLVTRRIGDRVFLVGDQRTAVSADCPPLAPRTTVAAAKEANVVLSWVIGEADGPAEIKLVHG
ncbi:MAG: sulfur carrier protein ThiS adenylyltransferase ThiF, partial [Heliobacteriaceae bacterium]|nr:sulfur carrier protein ThiS adenylyltransferase ThiF [Heliobacteriaceae bacterium]